MTIAWWMAVLFSFVQSLLPSPVRSSPLCFSLSVRSPLFCFWVFLLLSLGSPAVAREWPFFTRSCLTISTNASVSLKRNRGRKLAPLCIVSVLVSYCFLGVTSSLEAEKRRRDGGLVGQLLSSSAARGVSPFHWFFVSGFQPLLSLSVLLPPFSSFPTLFVSVIFPGSPLFSPPVFFFFSSRFFWFYPPLE